MPKYCLSHTVIMRNLPRLFQKAVSLTLCQKTVRWREAMTPLHSEAVSSVLANL